MNHIYRIIWNETLGTWVAVAENVKKKGKRSSKALKIAILAVTGALSVNLYASSAQCVPVGNCISTDNGFTQTITLTSDVGTAIGAKISGSDGKNGRAGALFVPPKAGGAGETIEGATYIQWEDAKYDPTTTTTIIKYIKTGENAESPAEYKVITFTPRNDKKSGEEGYDSLFGDLPPMMNVTTTTYKWDVTSATYKEISLVTNSIVTDILIDETTGDVKITPKGYNFTITDNLYTHDSGSAENGTALQIQDASGQTIPFKTIVNGENKTLTLNDSGVGVYSSTEGGDGGNGGSYYLGGKGKVGGKGGDASNTQLDVSDLKIDIKASNPNDNQGSIGILVKSQGGDGGKGGGSYTISATGGNGSVGGVGKDATANVFNTNINIQDDYSAGIAAISVAGDGGNGGKAGGIVSSGGNGNSAGQAGSVSITTDSKTKIKVDGNNSSGILAQSIGGAGGKSGNSIGLVALGGQGGHGGNAGMSSVTNYAQIEMTGELSNAITAQSLGGGGGNGGFSAALVALGAKGGAGGNGDEVTVVNGGKLTTNGYRAAGILAQSIGGGGGNGGLTVGLVSIGGDGTGGGIGGGVDVSTTTGSNITTIGDESVGIHAQSIGGGGGNGGLNIGSVTIGAEGGTGNYASEVTVSNRGNITTKGNKGSSAILAQSIGGGGGNGSMSVAVGGLVSVAIGGKGASGGKGGEVKVSSAKDAVIETKGEDASAIVAQSIGGGGGNGGMAVSTSAGVTIFNASVALGGKGGEGASSGKVTVNNGSKVVTEKNNSLGIFAQSLGGGGGNGGVAISTTAGVSLASFGLAFGGKGGGGATSDLVSVTNSGSIETKGINSIGILAQSFGGGGGNGGLTVSATGAINVGSLNLSFGGNGGTGGNSGKAEIINTANITTTGTSASALVSQSIGGAGGNAGNAISGSATVGVGAVNLAFGGSGGQGGQADLAYIKNNAINITTLGDNASAINASSIGGDGGNAGLTISGAIGQNSIGSLNLSMSGHGSSGGKSGAVIVDSTGQILTTGINSNGITAASIGGNGGNGGLAVSGALGGSQIKLAFGGDGGTGGNANKAIVSAKRSADLDNLKNSSFSLITTAGHALNDFINAGGIESVEKSKKEKQINKAIVAKSKEKVELSNAEIIPETEVKKLASTNSIGILAQSIGGNGGNGGMSIAAGASIPSTMLDVGFAMGGKGGTGGNAQQVLIDTDHDILTLGKNSTAIVAQSIGGDGGNGGGALSASAALPAVNAQISLGGSSGKGGNSTYSDSIVEHGVDGQLETLFTPSKEKMYVSSVISQGNIVTLGDHSGGVLAQSLGGSGGNGGFSISAGAAVFANAAVALGGSGNIGGKSSDVSIQLNKNKNEEISSILTVGDHSVGALAQSIGGDGGNGGFSVAAGLTANLYGGVSASVALGGSGGTGGKSGNTFLDSKQKIQTLGDFSSALQAQSIGGSGGNGGFSIAAALAGSIEFPSAAFSVALGGKGGKGGDAGNSTITSIEQIQTYGDFSNGVVAQSVGGDGGTGGFTGTLSGSFSPKGAVSASVSIGGSGGSGGKSGIVEVGVQNDIFTIGTLSSGIVAQSIGGSGGSGGLAASGAFTVTATGPAIALGSSVGGSGGLGAQAQQVTVLNSGNISTSGDYSYGILAQSINGNGGSGGVAANLSGAFSKSTAVSASVSIGGSGGGLKYTDDVQDVKENGKTIGKIDEFGTLTYSGVTRDTDGYQINENGQRVNSNNLTISAVTTANSSIVTDFGTGLDEYGYRVDANNRQILDANGEKILAVGYQTNINGHYFIKDSSGIFLDQLGYLRNLEGNYLSASDSGSILNENRFVIDTTGTYDLDEQGHKIKKEGDYKGYYLAEDGKTNINADGHKVNKNGDEYEVDTSKEYEFAVADKQSFATLENPQLVLTQIDGMYTVEQQVKWQAFLNAIKYKELTRTKNDVIVKNKQDDSKIKIISTEGYGADGILAQSIGGNGGVGGMSISGAGAASLDGAAVNASVAVGGSGGKGGISGDVTVENTDYVIATQGDFASAIRAQSIGGSGGKGGLSIAAGVSGSVQTAASLTASVGGGGGTGNVAGNVSIVSTNDIEAVDESGQFSATIATEGNSSHGIAAESIGGGGGDGGFSGSFAVSASLEKSAPAVALSIGGQAGDTNTSGNVTVRSIDNISTKGIGSSGILAKSIAGSGGDGGFALSVSASANITNDKSALGASIAVGGFGGYSNAAGQVNVDSQGFILSKGDYSNGVLAQSIGGGGGNGGMAISVDALLAQNGMGLSASVGGWGGTGGKGGVVDIQRLGDISTSGNRSAGILAQSLGGGGGNGGNSYSGSVYIDGLKSSNKATNITASVGGFGGSGNTADKVTIYNIGNISTSGWLSSAIQAQSIGGGGGNGGNSSTMTLKLQCGDLCNNLNSSDTSNNTVTSNTGTSGSTNNSDSNTNTTEATKSDTNISLSVGGWGGTGNDADNVKVISSGFLETSERGSHGIYAQSIGGGGGDGGSSLVESKVFNLTDDGTELLNPSEIKLNDNKLTFALGVGGYKGAAGDSGDVIVEHSGVIVTKGRNSKGILAQAIGGGGGNGGDSEGATVGVGGGALQEELAIGMSALAGVFGQDWDTSDLTGSAGNAGSVKIITKKTQLAGDIQNIIYTTGNRSDAIFAQSVGGGGGIGGSASAKLAIGGDGGAAGDGGTVSVNNELSLLTKGLFARGIFAQSIGGGGGIGGDVEDVAAVGIGGSGKNAGNANVVTVNNDAAILTAGHDSQGILAQSIGGGGGTGGSVEQASLAIGGGALPGVLDEINAAKLLGTSIFKTATGGNGEIVTVNNSVNGAIETWGDRSSAIQAQSIGGGGGIGGNASGTVSVGGFGSAAGDGHDVIISNAGNLQTHGKNSSAIVAQSIGGGGGDGGASNGGVETQDGVSTKIKEAYIAVGGNGAHAGHAGKVHITNNAELIYTEEENSKGILAQSIGGGGGQGGESTGIDIAGMIDGAGNIAKAKLGSIGLGSGTTASIISAMTSVSDLVNTAQGVISSPLQEYFNFLKGYVAGGNASGVVVQNNNINGRIVTKGQGSDAIVAQSIGGGGGTSGSASGILIAGAASGANGIAKDVMVENNGDLITLGDHSATIVAQSIGGGGGLTSGINQIAEYTQLGAQDSTGIADKVKVSNTGMLITDGKLSQAIIAQSIGGGGGATGLSHQLVLGGMNNAGSDAQTVDVVNSGYIETTTNGSSAIIAQSIGGGGGFAAGVIDGNVKAGHGLGNSADVTISNGQLVTLATVESPESEQQTKGIRTFGDYAHGIVAQSIANGGGYANSLDSDGNVQGYSTIANNLLESGESGNITVNQHELISTTGIGSVGILAQSTGKTSGNIRIINTADAVIYGGSESGAAIRIIDGKDNLVSNAGVLTGSSADNVMGTYLLDKHDLIEIGYLNANAILGGSGSETINNTGFITGNLDLDTGTNAFNNMDSGWLLSGHSLIINGLAKNTANWAVSGVNAIGETNLIGDFEQTNSGVYFWDWNFKPTTTEANATARRIGIHAPNYDVMNVSGNVVLDGILSVNIMNPGYVKPGDFELNVINATNVDFESLVLNSVASAVTKYNRHVINGNQGVVTADIDFAQKGLTKNGLSLGNAINQIQLDEISAFRPIAAPLFYRPNLERLQETYNLLSGEGTVANQQLYFTQNAGVMSDISMQMDFWRSRSVHAKNNGFVTVGCSSKNELGTVRSDVKGCLEDNKWSLWLAGHNGSQEQRGKTALGMANINSNTYRTMVGLNFAVTPDTLLGATYSSGKTTYDVKDRLTKGQMSVEGVNLFAMHNFEKAYIKGLIGYDKVTSDIDRFAFIDAALDPIIPVAGIENNLSGQMKADAYSLRLEVGHMYKLNGVNITPFLGAQYTQLETKVFSEKAQEHSDLLALQYEKSRVYSAPLFIGAQIDKNFVFSEGVIQPYARVSFLHELSTKREMNASFASAKGYTFTTQGGEPQHNSFDMNLGFKMTSITNLVFYGQFNGQYSSNGAKNNGGTLGIEFNW